MTLVLYHPEWDELAFWKGAWERFERELYAGSSIVLSLEEVLARGFEVIGVL